MQKSAPSDAPIHQLIRDRWSPRAFSDKPVAPDVLRSIFEAARWAPSSFNEQPWVYFLATKDDPENYNKLLGVLIEFNQGWAKQAPVLGLAVAELNFAKTGQPNRNGEYDTGAASALLCVEATARGLVVHQMAGYDPDKARKVFSIPKEWAPIAAMAIGYAGDHTSLPEALQERELAPRTRKALDEFVMSGTWGHTASFAAK